MKAILKDAPLSAQKARLVVDQIRGVHVEKALDTLNYMPKKGAVYVRKLLESAIANAEHNNGEDIEELFVSVVMVNEATTLKRFKARAKGRGNRILKRRCHISIELSTAA